MGDRGWCDLTKLWRRGGGQGVGEADAGGTGGSRLRRSLRIKEFHIHFMCNTELMALCILKDLKTALCLKQLL